MVPEFNDASFRPYRACSRGKIDQRVKETRLLRRMVPNSLSINRRLPHIDRVQFEGSARQQALGEKRHCQTTLLAPRGPPSVSASRGRMPSWFNTLGFLDKRGSNGILGTLSIQYARRVTISMSDSRSPTMTNFAMILMSKSRCQTLPGSAPCLPRSLIVVEQSPGSILKPREPALVATGPLEARP